MLGFKFSIFLMTIFIILCPSLARARWSLTPRLSVEEQYDDNIFLTETDEQDDFITTISPGVDLKYESPTQTIDLDYEFQRLFYTDFSELDYSGHRGRAEARKDFSPRFSAGIRELLISSEEPIELTGIRVFERPSIRTEERAAYTRNIVEPDATFRFGETRSIRLQYRNNILKNQREDFPDQDENAINALLTFFFNVHNGVEVFYEHIDWDYDWDYDRPGYIRNFDGDEIRGTYTYHFDPRTSAFVKYQYYERDFDQEATDFVDYKVHDQRLGFSRELYENVSVSASAGYAVRNADGGDDEGVFSGRLDLSAQYKRLDADVYGETGFGEDFSSAWSYGFNESWRIGFDGRYQLLERLSAWGHFYLQNDRFVDLNRRDKFWNIRGRLSYQPLKWLIISFDYNYNKRDSNFPSETYTDEPYTYTDNRYLFRVTTQYDIAELF